MEAIDLQEINTPEIEILKRFLGKTPENSSLIYLSWNSFKKSYYIFNKLNFFNFSTNEKFEKSISNLISYINNNKDTNELCNHLVRIINKINNFNEIKILNRFGFFRSKKICLLLVLLLINSKKLEFKDLKIEDKEIIWLDDWKMKKIIELWQVNNSLNMEVSKILWKRT